MRATTQLHVNIGKFIIYGQENEVYNGRKVE